LDIEFMKRLDDRVNIIPVIAKSDTLTAEELRSFKKSIMQEIVNEKIKLYEFPDAINTDEKKLNKISKDKVPFAVVGSNFVLERSNNRRTRVRQYAWGTVDGNSTYFFFVSSQICIIVEDESHSDFIALRNMIIKTNLNDLRDVTQHVHYENYRYKKLTSFNSKDQINGKNLSTSFINKNLLSQIDDEKLEGEQRLTKMEQEMESVYQTKVEEKLQKLEENKNNVKPIISSIFTHLFLFSFSKRNKHFERIFNKKNRKSKKNVKNFNAIDNNGKNIYINHLFTIIHTRKTFFLHLFIYFSFFFV